MNSLAYGHRKTITKENLIPGQYIVVFKDQAGGKINQTAAQEALQRIQSVLLAHSISKDSLLFKYQYALKGFSAKLSPEQVKRLKMDLRVDYVTPAKMAHVGYSSIRSFSLSSFSLIPKDLATKHIMSGEIVPWGVTRVNGPLDGTGKTAWILDTGVDVQQDDVIGYEDLNIDIANSVNFIATETLDDQSGHGTHVAGILAALNNYEGVVGVAAGATVIAIKVCDGSGSCPGPQLLNGIDYVSHHASPDDIVNMSIWSNSTWPALDTAVLTAANNGVRLVLIAGNDSADANYNSPGRVNHTNIWTVSAYDIYDNWANFSSYGNPPVDYGGPGVDILSLGKNGGTATFNGTSQAAPHIAGLLLAEPNQLTAVSYVTGDPDSNPDPILIYDDLLPLTATISGPLSLDEEEVGYWHANVSNADGTYNLQWYYRHGGNWIADGSGSSMYSHTFTNVEQNGPQASVKVVVDDGTQQAYDMIFVIINDPDCPPFQLC